MAKPTESTNASTNSDTQTGRRAMQASNFDLEGPPVLVKPLAMGLGSKFFETMEQNKDKLHQLDATTGITETKGSVKSRAIQLAMEMRNRGVKENQVVVISSRNHLELTVAVLACLFIGAVIVPLNFEMGYDDFKLLIVQLQPKLAFCGVRSAGLLARILKEKDIKCPIIVFCGALRDHICFSKCFDNKADPSFTPAAVADPRRTTAFVVCTPGTEDHPKLVALSHYSVFIRYSTLTDYFKKNEKLLSFFPLSATLQVLINCLCFETQSVLIFAGQFTERGALKYIYDLRIEHAFFETEFALRILKNAPLQDFNMSFLKAIFIGGAFISAWNITKLIRCFPNVRIRASYRLAEVGAISVLTEEHVANFEGKVNSAGTLQPGVVIRIINVETRQVVGPNKWGQLLVKAPGMMTGYFMNPQATSHSFNKGFFRTGDIAQYDDDGFLYVRCRMSELVSRDGQSFSLLEVEQAIAMLHSISEVAVFEAGNDLVAAVVKKPGHEVTPLTIIEYLENALPENQRPTKIEFYEFFPKTINGIIRKHSLKENISKIIREESFYHADHED